MYIRGFRIRTSRKIEEKVTGFSGRIDWRVAFHALLYVENAEATRASPCVAVVDIVGEFSRRVSLR